MMKNLLTLIFVAFAWSAYSTPLDSIGTKIVNGKYYILHKVNKGEGVYGISKRYGVKAADVYAANEGAEKSIIVGQVLLIPKPAVAGSGSTASSSTTTKTEKIYHTVAKGQTLSSIARMHNTSVVKIKELNNLKSDQIKLGQKLQVGEKSTVIYTSKPASGNAVENKPVETPVQVQAKTESNTESAQVETTRNNVVVKAAEPVNNNAMAEKPGTVNTTYSTDDGDEVNESGMAVISNEGDLGQDRSFIIHPSAKIGTIVMITNPSNNNTVFARVVGNCKPESGFILKMSKTVASKLGVSENTEVKVSYAK